MCGDDLPGDGVEEGINATAAYASSARSWPASRSMTPSALAPATRRDLPAPEPSTIQDAFLHQAAAVILFAILFAILFTVGVRVSACTVRLHLAPHHPDDAADDNQQAEDENADANHVFASGLSGDVARHAVTGGQRGQRGTVGDAPFARREVLVRDQPADPSLEGGECHRRRARARRKETRSPYRSM